MHCARCGAVLGPGARFCATCGTAVPEGVATAAAPAAASKKNTTIVVVAIVAVVAFFVIAFLGIIAAIAIPNFLTAKERAMQRRTIADMRQASMSVETYRESHNALPDSIEPRKDAWGNDLRYKSDGTNYWIVSAAKDGRFEQDDPSHYEGGTTTNFDDDIVMKNGELLRGPMR